MSLADILDVSARANPDKVAVRFGARTYTYRGLQVRVERLAGALLGMGVARGNHVALISPNSSACIEVLFACAKIGAVCELYNTRLSAVTIGRLLARSDADVVFLSRCVSEAMPDIASEAGRPLHFVLLEGGGQYGVTCYEALIETSKGPAFFPDVMPDEPAVMLYTSGTTGMPKGVLISHGALLDRIAIDTVCMGFSENDVTLCVLPLFHVTFVSSLATLAAGGQLVIARSAKPEEVAANIVERGVTRVGLVPFLLRCLAGYVEREGIEVKTLELVIYGGEPMDVDLLTRCQRLFACDFLQGYGMTETLGAVAMLLPEHHRDPSLLKTVGIAAPGMEVRIVDDEGTTLPAGVSGEVQVKTSTLMLGYYCEPERTDLVVRDGWYRTGDIGVLDEEGFLSLLDRKDNLVITGGENVYPAEVARCIKGMSGVEDAVVVGVPDPYWGETLAAFVVRKVGANVSEQDVVEQCALQLGGYKKPRKVLFVEGFERSASGKVFEACLNELKERLADKEGRNDG